MRLIGRLVARDLRDRILRPVEPLPRGRALLGIDLGGTKIAFALGGEDGHPRRERRRPTEPSGDPAADVARMRRRRRALLAEEGLAAGRPRAVGVSVPGPFDPETGTVLRPPNLPGWDDVPLRDWLGGRPRRPGARSRTTPTRRRSPSGTSARGAARATSSTSRCRPGSAAA